MKETPKTGGGITFYRNWTGGVPHRHLPHRRPLFFCFKSSDSLRRDRIRPCGLGNGFGGPFFCHEGVKETPKTENGWGGLVFVTGRGGSPIAVPPPLFLSVRSSPPRRDGSRQEAPRGLGNGFGGGGVLS